MSRATVGTFSWRETIMMTRLSLRRKWSQKYFGQGDLDKRNTNSEYRGQRQNLLEEATSALVRRPAAGFLLSPTKIESGHRVQLRVLSRITGKLHLLPCVAKSFLVALNQGKRMCWTVRPHATILFVDLFACACESSVSAQLRPDSR